MIFPDSEPTTTPPEVKTAPPEAFVMEEELTPLEIAPPRPVEEEIIFSALSNHEPLPMLDVIFSRVAAAFSPMLKSQNGFLSETKADALSYENWDITTRGMHPESCACIVQTSWGGSIVIALDPIFMHAAIASMFGGTAGRDSTPMRPATVIEKAFAQRLMQQLADEMVQHISRIVEVKLTLEAVESPSQINSLLAANAQVAVSRLKVTLGAVQGVVSVVLPLDTLESVRPQLGKMFLGEKLGGDVSWRDHFVGHISSASMGVEVELGRTQVPLADILQWRPGVTIDLGVTMEQEAVMRCSGIAVMRGVTGRKRNGRVALRITGDCNERAEGTDDDLFVD